MGVPGCAWGKLEGSFGSASGLFNRLFGLLPGRFREFGLVVFEIVGDGVGVGVALGEDDPLDPPDPPDPPEPPDPPDPPELSTGDALIEFDGDETPAEFTALMVMG